MRARLVVVGCASLFLCLGIAALDARPAFYAGRAAASALESGSRATLEADVARAQRSYMIARIEIQRAKRALNRPFLRFVSKVPILGAHLRSASEMAEGADLVAQAGLKAAAWWNQMQPGLRISGGTDVSLLREGGEGLAPVQALLARAAQTVRRGPPPLTAYTTRFQSKVSAALAEVKAARQTLPLVATMLSGNRQYFIAMQVPSELRGTGGLIGAYGLLEVRDGRMRLGAFGRPRQDLPAPASLGVTAPDWYTKRYSRYSALSIWSNVNMTPDYPTTASLIAESAKRIPSIGRVDGVIAMDPVAVAALLKITGPVRVTGWPDPVSALNAVEVMGNKTYARYEEDDSRLDFVAEVTQTVWAKLLNSQTQLNNRGLRALGAALAGRHIQLWSAHDDEQGRLRRAGVTGELVQPRVRSFGVISQNYSGHKADFFLRRNITYDIRLQPGGSALTTVTVRVFNGAPASGQPRYVIGPYPDLKEDRPGDSRSFTSVYAPVGSSLLQALEDGAQSSAESASELGVPVFSHLLHMGAGATSTFQTKLWTENIADFAGSRGALDLVFRTQPLLFSDLLTVRLSGEGWSIAPRGTAASNNGVVEWRFRHDRDVRVRADLEKK